MRLTRERANQLLSIKNLKVAFGVPGSGFAPKEVVHGLSFDLLPGQKLAVVGESGSGKTVSAQADRKSVV